MSEENKKVELKEEDLEKVSGGANVTETYSSIDRGDVFISKTKPTEGIISLESVNEVDDSTFITYRYIEKKGDKWEFINGTYSYKVNRISINYYYSYEYSQKTGLL